MAIKTLRVFAEYTSTGFVPMPTAGGIDYGYTLANTFPSTTPSTFQTDDPDIDVTVTAMTDFYVWIRINGTAWNPSYTRNVRVYPDSPDINSVVMNMIIATGPAGVSSYTQIVQTANRLYFNGATTDSVYNSKFAGKTYINELNFGTAPQLATVATSGAYADLSGKPALATVATSGSYADLSSKPSGTAPLSYNSGTNSFQITQANSTTNGFLTSTDWNTFNNKYLLPSGGTTAQYLRGDGTIATFPTTLDSTRLIMSGRNTTGTTLTKGTVVYINGVSGNTPLFARAIASGDSTSAQTLGVVEFDIANNATGVVVLVGAVNNLDTSSYTEGVQLYLSGTTAGAFTSSKILAPTHLVYVGIVTRAHPTLGTIEVKIQNGYELDEIHDVQISSPADKHILYYDNATTLWKHSSVTSVLGYTPYNATNPSNYIARTALSASAPLSYNNTTGAFTIAQANGSTNGFLSSTDWTTFNSKQSALTLGNVSEVSSNVLMFPDGGTGKTIGNLSIQVVQAGASTNGYLSSTDWTTFNNKQSALTLGNFTEATSSVLTITGGTGAVIGSGLSVQVKQANTTTNGFLSSTDWNTFNNKQGTITLTTTGTSGAATLSSGTLNIPQYQSVLTNPVTGTGTTNYVTKWTSSSAIGNSIIQDNGTNVGIGTTSSSWSLGKALELNNKGNGLWNASAADTRLMTNVYFNGGFFYGSNGLASIMETGDGFIWRTAPIGTANASATFTERMRITSAGNVGIGTTSPSSLLHVVATSGQATIISEGSATSGEAAIQLRGKNSSGTSRIATFKYDNSDIIRIGTSDAIPMRFETSDVERMRITSGGNVGVGTTSPTVFGGGMEIQRSAQAALRVSTTSGTLLGGAEFGYESSIGAYIQTVQANGQFSIYTGNASVLAMRITSGGNAIFTKTVTASGVTVNDTVEGGAGFVQFQNNGTQKFNLATIQTSFDLGFYNNGGTNSFNLYIKYSSGNVLLGTTTDNGERLYVSGSIRATGNITANSDLTLKKNLKLIENPAEKLMSLNGYSYQWKENDEYQYGVIAQEVEKVMSYAVQTGKTGIKGVAYNQLTPLLIEGFKLHNSEITQLKERVKYLEAKLA